MLCSMKNDLNLSLGTEILYQGQPHIIQNPIYPLTTFTIQQKNGG